MKIAIYGQFYPKNSEVPVQLLFDFLDKQDVSVLVEKQFLKTIRQEHELDIEPALKTFEKLDPTIDLLISIGGDGTMLRAATFVKDLNIPVVGINTGRLGFLATIQENNMETALSQILSGHYNISERTVLEIFSEPGHHELQDLNFALNEITISRKDTTSMITVETYLNNEYLTSYWADGLIISTPTGSTGYSLSCGGPVIMPDTDNLILTPIAPHNLNARPLVISGDTEIRMTVSGRENHYLVSLDSRLATLEAHTTVVVKKADFTIKMIELEDESFLKTIRKKLLWGEDKRN